MHPALMHTHARTHTHTHTHSCTEAKKKRLKLINKNFTARIVGKNKEVFFLRTAEQKENCNTVQKSITSKLERERERASR